MSNNNLHLECANLCAQLQPASRLEHVNSTRNMYSLLSGGTAMSAIKCWLGLEQRRPDAGLSLLDSGVVRPAGLELNPRHGVTGLGISGSGQVERRGRLGVSYLTLGRNLIVGMATIPSRSLAPAPAAKILDAGTLARPGTFNIMNTGSHSRLGGSTTPGAAPAYRRQGADPRGGPTIT